MHVKWSVILADRLGSEIFTILEIKRHFLYRVRLHLRVPGWLSDLNALLTRKLPMCLMRLDKISGGRGNMCLVSGSLRKILKFLRMTWLQGFVNVRWGWMEWWWFLRSVAFVVRPLSVDFLDAMFACVDSGVRIAAFFEKLAHFLAFVVKVGVVITSVNSFPPALKYYCKISENSLALLDIELSINDNGLSTSVHYKPTDSHNYLLHSYSHTQHVKNAIPNTQRRLCRHTLCKKIYIGETGRRFADRFREHLRDVEENDTDESKPVARHFNLPNHSHHNTENRKNLEQKFIS